MKVSVGKKERKQNRVQPQYKLYSSYIISLIVM
jgi:hypothetical protein